MSNITFTVDILHNIVKRPKSKGKPLAWGSIWVLGMLDSLTYPYKGSLLRAEEPKISITVPVEFRDDGTVRNFVEWLDSKPRAIVKNASIAQIKRARKLDDGSWENYTEPGIKAKMKDFIEVDNNVRVNNVEVEGTVKSTQDGLFVLSERYMIPSKGWTERDIVVISDVSVKVGDKVFVIGKVNGTTPADSLKAFVIGNIVLKL